MNEERVFNVYAVKDELTGKFMQPIFIQTDEEATRWFKYVLNTNPIWKYNAAMYGIYRLGYFKESTGALEKVLTTPELLQGGLAVLDKEE